LEESAKNSSRVDCSSLQRVLKVPTRSRGCASPHDQLKDSPQKGLETRDVPILNKKTISECVISF
jgi:hypothetical protein